MLFFVLLLGLQMIIVKESCSSATLTSLNSVAEEEREQRSTQLCVDSMKKFHESPAMTTYTYYLAREGKIKELAKYILRQGLDVNAYVRRPLGFGRTLLHCAIQWQNADLIDILLLLGANVEAFTISKHFRTCHRTPLGLALRTYNISVIRRIIRGDADTNIATTARSNLYPLHQAVNLNYRCAVEALLEAHADVLAVDLFLRTALSQASYGSNVDIVSSLLTAGARPNHADYDGETPLMLATRHDRLENFRQIIDHGGDLDLENFEGLRAVHCAVMRGSVRIVRYLVSLVGEDVDVADRFGRSALYFAVGVGSVEMVSLLVHAGADCNRPSLRGRTPTHLAAQIGSPEITRLIIEHRGNPNFCDVRNETPTHLVATRRDNDEVIGIILDAGGDVLRECIDVEAVENHHFPAFTPLSLAEELNTPSAIQLFHRRRDMPVVAARSRSASPSSTMSIDEDISWDDVPTMSIDEDISWDDVPTP